MHALQRPYLSRATRVSIVAALLAIMITLLFATALGDLNQPAGRSAPARQPAPAALSVQSIPSAILAQPTASSPAWLSGPFASLPRPPLP